MCVVMCVWSKACVCVCGGLECVEVCVSVGTGVRVSCWFSTGHVQCVQSQINLVGTVPVYDGAVALPLV